MANLGVPGPPRGWGGLPGQTKEVSFKAKPSPRHGHGQNFHDSKSVLIQTNGWLARVHVQSGILSFCNPTRARFGLGLAHGYQREPLSRGGCCQVASPLSGPWVLAYPGVWGSWPKMASWFDSRRSLLCGHACIGMDGETKPRTAARNHGVLGSGNQRPVVRWHAIYRR